MCRQASPTPRWFIPQKTPIWNGTLIHLWWIAFDCGSLWKDSQRGNIYFSSLFLNWVICSFCEWSRATVRSWVICSFTGTRCFSHTTNAVYSYKWYQNSWRTIVTRWLVSSVDKQVAAHSLWVNKDEESPAVMGSSALQVKVMKLIKKKKRKQCWCSELLLPCSLQCSFLNFSGDSFCCS